MAGQPVGQMALQKEGWMVGRREGRPLESRVRQYLEILQEGRRVDRQEGRPRESRVRY